MALDPLSIAVSIPSLGVIIAYGYSIIRRRISTDVKSLEEDKSYTDMLSVYKKERDEIKAERDHIIARMSIIENERNDAVSKVGKITAGVEFLSGQVKELKTLVEELRNSLEGAREEMQRMAIDNAKLSSQVRYLEKTIEQNKLGTEEV